MRPKLPLKVRMLLSDSRKEIGRIFWSTPVIWYFLPIFCFFFLIFYKKTNARYFCISAKKRYNMMVYIDNNVKNITGIELKLFQETIFC